MCLSLAPPIKVRTTERAPRSHKQFFGRKLEVPFLRYGGSRSPQRALSARLWRAGGNLFGKSRYSRARGLRRGWHRPADPRHRQAGEHKGEVLRIKTRPIFAKAALNLAL